MGDELLRLDRVANFGRSTERYVGALVLTTRGMGFVASDRDRDPVPLHGLAGIIFAALQSEFDKRVEANAARHAQIPLPVLSRIFAGVFWYPIEAGCSVELDGQVLTVRVEGRDDAWGLIEEAKGTSVEDWGKRTGVRVTRRVREGLWKTLARWFVGKPG